MIANFVWDKFDPYAFLKQIWMLRAAVGALHSRARCSTARGIVNDKVPRMSAVVYSGKQHQEQHGQLGDLGMMPL